MNKKQIVITITSKDVPKEYIAKLDKKLSKKIFDILETPGLSAEYHNHITGFQSESIVCGPKTSMLHVWQSTAKSLLLGTHLPLV